QRFGAGLLGSHDVHRDRVQARPVSNAVQMLADAALVVARAAALGALHQRAAMMADRRMANIRSQIKRIHRSERERLENRRARSAVKTHFRRLEHTLDTGNSSAVADEHRELVSRIDK